MKNIYDYRSYRQYLKDFYESQKASIRGYTYARFSIEAHLSSPNYLKLVIDGSRDLTPTTIQAFAKGLKLQGKDLDFFEALVLENQASTPVENKYYGLRVKLLRKSSSTVRVSRKTPTNRLPGTVMTALRLCSDGKSWNEALEIGKVELGLESEEVELSLRFLVETGELVRSEEGNFSLPERHTMISDPKALSQAQMTFLHDGLDEATQIFSERYPKGAAKFLSLLFTAEPGNLPLIFADLREAFEAMALKYDPAPEQDRGVYRAQLQVYRLKKDEV
jgi:uncharacterized protein (TIGR02147 family)